MKKILFSTVFLAACAADEPPPGSSPGPDRAQPYFGPNDDVEEQGRFLLGNLADRLASNGSHYWVTNIGSKGQDSFAVSVSADRLVATHTDGTAFTDADFVDMEFASGTRRLKITAVAIGPETGTLGYALSYHDGTDWQPYCAPNISSFAVPMEGAWTTDREHIDGPVLTFGCLQSGVTAKCIDWGYSPGGGGPTDSQWQQHQTCVQLAAADYCDRAVPRTREQTPIVIRDFIPGLKPDATEAPTLPTLDPAITWPPPDTYYVEAAWQYNGPAICLSKLRWASLPPGGFCPQELPDPRLPEAPPGAKYCEELTLTELEKQHGALFVTASKVMDIYAHTWRRPNGELLTTVEGYVENGAAVSAPFPADNYQLVGQSFILLRNLTGVLDPVADVTPIYMQHNPLTGDRVVAPINPNTAKGGVTNDHQVDFAKREGYLLNHFGNGLVRLKLFKQGNDYVTALVNPGGYNFVRDFGFVMAP